MFPGLHAFFGRVKSLLRGRRVDREMAEELEFHQTLLREKLLREGSAPAEADRATRRAFGNAGRWHERMREVRQFGRLENLLRDIRLSTRLLRKSPGFTAVALVTLALGTGANTAVFSMINGLLLRPLRAPDADRLAVLSFDEGGPEPDFSFCTPYFRSLESRRDLFANVFAFDPETMQVRGRSANEDTRGMLVSGQFFDALKTPPLLGRYLTREDDRRGGSPAGLAVVISETFWESWFGRAPDVVGRKLTIANTPFTVVGVMPKRFIGADPTHRPEIFVPLATDPIINAPRNHIDAGMHAWWLTVMARMQPGASLAEANAALRTVSIPILQEASGDAAYVADGERHHFHFAAETGSRGFAFVRYVFRKPLVAMFAMCVGILLLACLNLASLLTARGFSRERELATRLALGATRSRLMQQLLIESLLIAIGGTVLGLAAAPLAGRALAAMLMSSGPLQAGSLDTSMDARVFCFAIAMAAAAALTIGLVPAMQATGGSLNEHLSQGQHASKAHVRRSVLPRILMAAEVGLALVLVSGAGLLTMSLVKLYRSGAGFDPKGLVNIAFSMDKQPLEGDRLMQVYRQLGEGLQRQPGVKDVSFQSQVPLSHRGWNGLYAASGKEPHLMMMNSVAPEYFRTMRIPLRAGREFWWSDTKASGMKIILNESAARTFFPEGEALGRTLVNPREKTSYEVVAVVRDAKYRDMRSPAPPTGYVPIMQDPQEKPSLSAVVRLGGPLAPVTTAARSLAARLAPSIPAPIFTTYDEMVDNSLGAERMMAVLAVFFAGCALLVTGIGLYGTLAYATSRRTSEIGIRMALGARREQVVAMIFRQNMILAVVGSAAGLIAAVLVSRALTSFLYETSPRDPWILLGSVAALCTIACAASLVPALRAARIEPIAAIRCE
ncbi:MAG TPA: ABC transporter permease [Acidobacteriaceae bacterium]